jgi:flagellar capping protein FliD
MLTGAAGEEEEGLGVTVSQTNTGDYGYVTYAPTTKGVEGNSIFTHLQTLLDGITDPLSGPIHHSTDSFNQNIRILNNQIGDYTDRLAVKQQMLTNMFSQADEALRQLTVTQSSISSQVSSLPS